MSLRRRNRPSLIVSIAFMAGWFLSNDCFASGGVNIDDAIKATYSRLQLRFIFLNSQLDKIPLKQRPASLQAEYLGLRSSFHKLATAIQDQDSDLFNELSEMEDKLPAYQSDLYFLVKTIAPEKVASGLGGDPGNIDGFNHDSDGDDDFVLFHNKKTRVAVFTFDDPDRTGLGDSISFLLAKKLLYSALVSSFAVVNYSQGAERDQMGSYFDKVDLQLVIKAFCLPCGGGSRRSTAASTSIVFCKHRLSYLRSYPMCARFASLRQWAAAV